MRWRSNISTCKSLVFLFIVAVVSIAIVLKVYSSSDGISNTRLDPALSGKNGNVLKTRIKMDDMVTKRRPVLLDRKGNSSADGSFLTDVTSGYVVCISFDGGLGNHMFQYASSYGIARKLNAGVVIHPNSEINKVFKPRAKISSDPKLCSKVKSVEERKALSFDERFFHLPSRTDYKFLHYLQSWKYFRHVEDELRQQYIFHDDVIGKAKSVIARELARLNETWGRTHRALVGLHVRRGDYLQHKQIKAGYVVADMSYINKAMNYFNAKFKDAIFFILSDDMKWCKQNIKGLDVIYTESNPREVDLAVMSLLNHTIMTVGTFGYWGAWLCEGETVYMKDVALPNSNIQRLFSADKKDFFFPHWIGM